MARIIILTFLITSCDIISHEPNYQRESNISEQILDLQFDSDMDEIKLKSGKTFKILSNTKDDLVLVLGSQNTFATILSGKRSSFRKLPWSSIKLLENSIRSNISCFDKSVIERRLLAIS